MIFYILIPLSELIFALACLFFIVTAISIDGGAILQSVIQANAEWILIGNFVLCIILIFVLLKWGLRDYKCSNKTNFIINASLYSYKIVLIAIYCFVCNCFIIIPQLIFGNIIEIFFNTIGAIFFSIIILAILLVMWGCILGIQWFIENTIMKGETENSVLLNIVVKSFTTIAYTFIFYKWIVLTELPWMLSQTSMDAVENIYGKSIITFFEYLQMI